MARLVEVGAPDFNASLRFSPVFGKCFQRRRRFDGQDRKSGVFADIERDFKVLKSEIQIGRVYDRPPERIRSHASICFMALILHRVMRSRLKATNAATRARAGARATPAIQHHRVRLNSGEPVAKVTTIGTDRKRCFMH